MSKLGTDGSKPTYKTHGKLLIDDEPLQLLPDLAVSIGLNDAIVFQQLHFWSHPKKNQGFVKDKKRWILNSYEEWQESNFPFFTVKQIGDAFRRLEKQGLIVSRSDLHKNKSDRRKFYAVDYDSPAVKKLMGIEDSTPTDNGGTSGYDQNTSGYDQNTSGYDVKGTENTAENTTEKSVPNGTRLPAVPENPDDSLSGLEGYKSAVKERKNKKSPAPRAKRDDRRVWAMVDAYFEARGLVPHKMPDDHRNPAYSVFAKIADQFNAQAVYGCTAYLASQQWYQEAGRLKAKAVSNAIFDWDAKGRPTAEAPKGGGSSGFAQMMGGFADYAKEQGQ